MHYNPFAYIHSEKDILKLVTAPATTGNRANDTPVQPQSERDKRHFDREAVAGNGGGCERTS